VVVRSEAIASAEPDDPAWLGLIADVGTSNVIDMPVDELIEHGFDPTGSYVGVHGDTDDAVSASRLRLLGRVIGVDGDMLVLDDVREDAANERVPAADVFPEPRRETLEAVVKQLYPRIATEALKKLRRIRGPYLSGERKLAKIQRTIEEMNKSLAGGGDKALRLQLGDGLRASFGPLLNRSSPHFPRMIETSRPGMLFGPSGHDQANQPDQGIRQFGPFQYTHNPVNDPMIAVLCDKQARGRMDQFAKLLRDGLDEDYGRFSGGLIGKFRLTSARFQFFELSGDSGDHYAAAAQRVLDDLPTTPALALVQVRESHKQRASGQNPYFVAKARFMRAGVPVQAVRLETVEANRGRAFTLNNLALAAYAKIGGVPWVISTRGVATHELVIGIGCTEVGSSRLGERARYVGITTLFQGDGRYLVWETTREASFDDYPEALLASLRKSVRFVRDQNKWEAGDPVRLIFHVYKPLKRSAGKNTVSSDNRSNFLAWLQTLHDETHGNADLVAHFFRRAFNLLRPTGVAGLIATNTIGQGDTRTTGLTYILAHDGHVHRAVQRLKWPGEAAVTVSVVHFGRMPPAAPVLDEHPVTRISAFLIQGDLDDKPFRLTANRKKCFSGSKVYGEGFLFQSKPRRDSSSLAELDEIGKKHPAEATVIKPYFSTEDITENPTLAPQRWVIDFGERTLGEVRRFPRLLKIVEEKVRPFRLTQKHQSVKDRWWLFEGRRTELYTKLSFIESALIAPQVAKHLFFVFMSTKSVFSHMVSVCCFDHFAAFAALQNRCHEIWVRAFGFTLEDRMGYSISDCFETFPFAKQIDRLNTVGKTLYQHRAALMVARNEGMTKTYNRFHDRTETDDDIERLRELHAAMDRAVLEAYGWHDLAARAEPCFLDESSEDDHTYQGRLFWPSDFRDEVIARLLALNAERHAEELRLGIAPGKKGNAEDESDDDAGTE
jgi:hypothetical protein